MFSASRFSLLRERTPMKILSNAETLVDELYNIMDMLDDVQDPKAGDIYHYINQLLLATVVDDD